MQYVSPRMNLGFSEMVSSGIKWRIIKVCSRVEVGLIVCVWYVGFPRCVVVNM